MLKREPVIGHGAVENKEEKFNRNFFVAPLFRQWRPHFCGEASDTERNGIANWPQSVKW